MRFLSISLVLLLCSACNGANKEEPSTDTSAPIALLDGAGLMTSPIAFGDKILFTAKDSDHGQEPWVSDGTKEGTHLLKDIAPLSDSSANYWSAHFSAPIFNAAGDVMLFARRVSNTITELWATDGTESGTQLIQSIDITCSILSCSFENDYQDDGVGLDFYSVAGDLFFIAKQDAGFTLWKTDGITKGTQKLADVNDPSNSITAIKKVFEYQGNVYVLLQLSSLKELWQWNESTSSLIKVAESLDFEDLTVNPNGIFTISTFQTLNRINLDTGVSDLIIDPISQVRGGGIAVGNIQGMALFFGSDPIGRDLYTVTNGEASNTYSLPLLADESFAISIPKLLEANSNSYLLQDYKLFKFDGSGAEGLHLIDETAGKFWAPNKMVAGHYIYAMNQSSTGTIDIRDYNPTSGDLLLLSQVTGPAETHIFSGITISENNTIFWTTVYTDDVDSMTLWALNSVDNKVDYSTATKITRETTAANFYLPNNTLVFEADALSDKPFESYVEASLDQEDEFYFKISSKADGVIDNITAPTSLSAKTGWLTISPNDPANLGPGIHKTQIEVHACKDRDCNIEFPGSPQTLTIEYHITLDEPFDITFEQERTTFTYYAHSGALPMSKAVDISLNRVPSGADGRQSYRILQYADADVNWDFQLGVGEVLLTVTEEQEVGSYSENFFVTLLGDYFRGDLTVDYEP